MRLGLLAKKVGMSRFYDSLGINHPVTILKVDESNVVDIKTNEKNGYSAVRLSLGKSKRNNNKPVKGFLKKQNIPAFLFQCIRNGGVSLCGMSELLCELVRHWADVVAIFRNTVHVSLVEASGDMQMRFALWAIIMQIGKKNAFFVMLLLEGVFLFKNMFGFVGSNIRFNLANILLRV